MPQPRAIKSHTGRLAAHLRETWKKLGDVYVYRGSWIDIQLYHRSHDRGLSRKMHLCWPADVRDELMRQQQVHGSSNMLDASDNLSAVGLLRNLELSLRSLQLVGWVIYEVQRRFPDGSEQLQVNWVWQMERSKEVPHIVEGDKDRALSSEPTL